LGVVYLRAQRAACSVDGGPLCHTASRPKARGDARAVKRAVVNVADAFRLTACLTGRAQGGRRGWERSLFVQYFCRRLGIRCIWGRRTAIGDAGNDGVPDDGVPDDGVPDDGVPDDGVPDDGVPDGGDVVVFDETSPGLNITNTNNDLAGLSRMEIRFVDNFGAPDFVIAGNASGLASGVAVIQTGSSQSSNIRTDVTTNGSTFQVEEGFLRVSGTISGTGGITKTGNGRLDLGHSDSCQRKCPGRSGGTQVLAAVLADDPDRDLFAAGHEAVSMSSPTAAPVTPSVDELFRNGFREWIDAI
jgi:hypothetical protein